MDLAFVTGYGPALLTDLRVAVRWCGQRMPSRSPFATTKIRPNSAASPCPGVGAYDLYSVRRLSIDNAARAAVGHLTRAELDGFFIHLDADCLDDDIMPAVDFRVPGGLSWDELETALRIILASEKAVGLEVAIYNPRLDRDGSSGRRLADVLAGAFGTVAPI